MFIGHVSQDGSRVQKLSDHLSDVSTYCKEFGESVGLGNVCRLAGLLHDMGKYSEKFQIYIKSVQEHIQDGTYDNWIKSVEKEDHGVYGAKFLTDSFLNTKDDSILISILSHVICFHHGGLPDCINDKYESPLLKRIKKVEEEQFEIVKRNFFSEYCSDEIIVLVKEASKECDAILRKIVNTDKKNVSFQFHFVVKLVFSILIDADRLNSYEFEIEEHYEEANVEKLWNDYGQRLDEYLTNLKNRNIVGSSKERLINQIRQELSDDCYEAALMEPGVYHLTIPTGGGKTLASLRYALRHAKLYHKKRIIYIIPYTTIIEQNAEEVRRILDCSGSLLEHHSNILEDNESREYKLLTERWDSPIIFTTMVQFLNTIYGPGNKNIRKFHNLKDAILIFDEIQALPIKCTHLFTGFINYMKNNLNTTTVLCTATKPALNNVKIPIQLSGGGELASDPNYAIKVLERMKVKDLCRVGEGYSYEEASVIIKDIKKGSKSVLVVVNTIDAAEKLMSLIKDVHATRFFFLSTHLCAQHRKDVIGTMKVALANGESVLCISTQLIEAGVDISFVSTVRSLAGLPSIAQTTGRGNRHGSEDMGVSYVINLAEESVSKLEDIRVGQVHTSHVLHEYKENPERFEHSLLSLSAIKRYYELYYSDGNVSSRMNYNRKHQEKTIYQSLSKEEAMRVNYNLRNQLPYPFGLTYQFKSARREFNVIDQNTKTILAPYGYGEEIITVLLGSHSLKEKGRLLRDLQPYTVNIFECLFQKLWEKEAITVSGMEGLYLLNSAYYSELLGVSLHKKLRDLMY